MVINRIRSFNRFYTRKTGLITNRYLKSDYSLLQARVLFELNNHAPLYAADLSKKFDLPPDSVSKLVARFNTLGLIVRTPSPDDSRKLALTLTPKGQEAYQALKERSNAWIEEMIRELGPEETSSLVGAMDTIEQLLDPARRTGSLVTLRPHRTGDIGYVIHRHGVLYAREYGFNHEFDAYVAKGMAEFVENFSSRDHLWIAETRNGFSGSVAIVHRNDQTAQLRWLIVEPRERQKGIGRQLIQEAIRFSREKGYRSVMLWTVDFLRPARRLYANAGFSLTEAKESEAWGQTLTEECWTLQLA